MNQATNTNTLKHTFELENNPEKVSQILRSFRKDLHFSITLEGTIKNGRFTGFYTNLASINGMVIGYVKIVGHYDRTNGNLKLSVIPSKLFWAVIAFNTFAIMVITLVEMNADKRIVIGLFLFMVLALTVAFILEKASFLKNLIRISQSSTEEYP